MNASQIHLALTHLPVLLSLVGLVVLVIAMFKRNDTLTKTSFYLLLFAGISAAPVYFTGEGAEETIEHLPGVSESIIERHESLANLAFGVVGAAAIVSLMGLLLYRQKGILRTIRSLALFLAIATSGVMAVTAHLGGEIRHTEIRAGFQAQTENETNGDMQVNVNKNKD